MSTIDQLQTVSAALSSPWTVFITTSVVEVGMRLFKTEKPQSLFYVLADISKKIAALLDVVMQRTQTPVENAEEKK